MAIYHVNTATGKAGACRARIRCPFGDLATEHFEDKSEAIAYYEKIADRTHKTPFTHEQLSAFRRSADFEEQPEDAELLYRLETEEDYRSHGLRQHEYFSAIDFDRVAIIAEEKLQHFGNDGKPLDQFSRSTLQRLLALKARAVQTATAIRTS